MARTYGVTFEEWAADVRRLAGAHEPREEAERDERDERDETIARLQAENAGLRLALARTAGDAQRYRQDLSKRLFQTNGDVQ